jgi:hypothetical protein
MKATCQNASLVPRRPRLQSLSSRAGSALVIVLVLLSVAAALVVSNTVVLRRLKVELQLLEQRQNRALQARLGTAEPRAENR